MSNVECGKSNTGISSETTEILKSTIVTKKITLNRPEAHHETLKSTKGSSGPELKGNLAPGVTDSGFPSSHSRFPESSSHSRFPYSGFFLVKIPGKIRKKSGKKSGKNPEKSPEKVRKKSGKSPEKSRKKSGKNREKVRRKSGENPEKVRRRSGEGPEKIWKRSLPLPYLTLADLTLP